LLAVITSSMVASGRVKSIRTSNGSVVAVSSVVISTPLRPTPETSPASLPISELL